MLEAMVAGRPVIVTPVGGILEIINDGENGLLVPPGNIEKLVEAIERLIVDYHKACSFGERVRKLIKNKYNLSSVVEAHQQIYKQIWEQNFQK
jgi:glycosyltransferase involved in cell wall biosynthesis